MLSGVSFSSPLPKPGCYETTSGSSKCHNSYTTSSTARSSTYACICTINFRKVDGACSNGGFSTVSGSFECERAADLRSGLTYQGSGCCYNSYYREGCSFNTPTELYYNTCPGTACSSTYLCVCSSDLSPTSIPTELPTLIPITGITGDDGTRQRCNKSKWR